MSEIDKFAELLERKVSDAGAVSSSQLRFAICKEVDWDNRTMTAEGVSDGLPYYNVQLGFGYVDIKPATDTVCLIGVLEGKDTLTFLINAEEVDLAEINVKKTVFNGGDNSGLVKIERLKDNINALKEYCEALKTAISSGLSGVGESTAASGSAGKTTFETAMTGKSISFKDMEDKNITH